MTVPSLGLYLRTSALDPGGPAAASIYELTLWMVWVFGGVFLIVMILLVLGSFGHPREIESETRESWFIIGGGIIFPTVILTGFLIYTLILTADLQLNSKGLPIRVTGHMWWWEVEYPELGIVTANEIYIPVGLPVKIELQSKDVIHSLWIPSLAGKMDLVPGHQNFMTFKASQPGIFWGQCAEYCGLAHGKMALQIVALENHKFQDWIRDRQKSLMDLKQTGLLKGQTAFHQLGCTECHTIRQRVATSMAQVGPDLSHIGSRLFLGAGAVANNKGNLMGWIINPQSLKPGNKMPQTYMSPEQLRDLTDYLMSLK